MARSEQACRISPSTRKTLEREYTALHEGARPQSIGCSKWSASDGVPHELGVAVAIQYKKRIPGEKPSYHHPWKFYAQPTIGVDASGHLHFKTGRYEVRRRGIEDRVPNGKSGSPYLVVRHVKTERWITSPPTRLVKLGDLEWVRYKSVGGSEKTLRFSSGTAPELAHDQNGNLHILGGSYRIRLNQEQEHMARRRHRRSRRHHARHNPTAILRSGRRSRGSTRVISAGKHAASLAAVVLVGGASAVGIDAILGATTLSSNAKAGIKGGVGALGLFGGSLAVLSGAPVVGSAIMGAGLGAGIEFLVDAWSLWVAPVVARMTAPAAPTAGNIAPTAGAAGAFLPAGAPSSYRAYNAQSCAVRSR